MAIDVLRFSSSWKYTTSFSDFFLLFNSVASAVTAYNVDVFKKN